MKNKTLKIKEDKNMANKRSLKRTINLVCEEILAECIAASLYGHNRASAEALIFSTLKMQNDFIRRVSHPEPGMPAKQYYKVLRESFIAHASDINDQICNNM
jgi:hypothetical protein